MKHFTLLLISALFASLAFGQLIDSDFSEWENGDPVGWKGQRTNLPNAGINEVDNDGGFGESAVQLIREQSGHQRFSSQPQTVQAGDVYEITFWARGSGEVRTGLYDGRETGFGYAPYNNYVVLTPEWTEYSQVVTVEVDTDEAEFIFSVRNTSEPAHVQIDRAVIGEPTIDSYSIFDIQFTEDPAGASPLVGQVVSTGGIVTAVLSGDGFFMQNQSGPWQGIFVFGNDAVSIGDSVIVAGTVQEQFGLTRIGSLLDVSIESSGNTLPEAVVVPTGDVGDEPWESVLVQVVNALCTDANSGFGQFIVDDGSGEILINRDIYDFPAFLNEVYSIRGPLYYSFSEFKIMPRDMNDVSITTSVQEWATSDIRIFPLPATDHVTIDWSGLNTESVGYRLFDQQGREVEYGMLRDGLSTISVNNLPAGVYLLRLDNEQQAIHQRIVVGR